MKVLIVGSDSQPIPPVNGGAVENLVRMFYVENEKNGFLDIMIISCRDEKISEEMLRYKNTSFYFVDKAKENRIGYLFCLLMHKFLKIDWIHRSKSVKEIISLISKIEFDVILIENNVEYVIPICRKFKHKKVFLHLHNNKLNAFILGSKKVVDHCEKIICVSEYIKQQVNTITGAPDKTITLLNSIEVDKFGNERVRAKREDLRKKYGIKEDEILVLFSGRVTKTKGVLELIRAFKTVKKDNIKLMIIGNHWYKKETIQDKYLKILKKECEPIKNRVLFTGYINYEEMPYYYGMADIAVVPSIWQEPCSLALFEAMASNVSLITTRTGGTTQVVKNYAKVLEVDDQFVKKLARSIEELSDDKVLRDAMASIMYEHVQKYNPERYYKEMLDILKGNADV